MSFNYKQSQLIEEKVNIPEINKQILELKKEFKKYTNNRIGEMYRILSKLVQLNKLKDKHYAPRSLEWEKDLNLNSVQIRYIFAYKYFSFYAKKLVEEEKIEEKTICFLIWRFSILRKEVLQNKLIDLYLKGDIKISELGWMNANEILGLINGKRILVKDRYLISGNKSICSLLSRLKQREVNTSNSKFKQELINSTKNLLNYLENKK
jgi:hypothetical protein